MTGNEIIRRRINLCIAILGSVLSTAVGVMTFRAVQHLRRILQQPPLVSRAVFTELSDSDTLEAKAVSIATENLLSGIERRRVLSGEEKLVLDAGWRNFREPWARDFGFASFGLLALQEFRVARETLEAFLIHQRPSGQFPVKIHSTGGLERPTSVAVV